MFAPDLYSVANASLIVRGRGGREVYRTALEMRRAARHREFESHPLRYEIYRNRLRNKACWPRNLG